MHKDNLPQKVDPFRFAESASSLHGSIPLKNMERLTESLASTEGEVNVDIVFGIDEQGIRFIKGRLSAQTVMQCQRCLSPFDYEIITDFAFGMVHTEIDADKLPESYDPVVIENDELFISELIEGELIVALPLVAMHDPKDCNVKLPIESALGMMPEVENESPFKVIESLRSKRNTK